MLKDVCIPHVKLFLDGRGFLLVPFFLIIAFLNLFNVKALIIDNRPTDPKAA